MKALVIGAGGSEHALAWKLAQSPAVTVVYTAPGNYGTSLIGPTVNIPESEPEALAGWAAEAGVDLTVVGAQAALASGVVDVFRERGLHIFGPTHAAARLGLSQAWSRGFMARHGIPTPEYQEFDGLEPALRYLQGLGEGHFPLLVAAEGGRGGQQASPVSDRESALDAARQLLAPRRGPQPRLVIREASGGIELSLMAITDGNTTLPLALTRTYARAQDGDTGPLTEGMGAYCPAGDVALVERIMDRIVGPALRGMAAEGFPYQGLLHAELLLTAAGPQALAFGASFGDPEMQVVLPRWENDLYVVLDAAIDSALGELAPFRWSADTTCGLVLASEGYPGEIETGYGVLGLSELGSPALAFHNNTRNPYRRGNEVVTPATEQARKLGLGRGMGMGGWLMPSRDRSKKLDRQAVRAAGDPYSQVITAGGRVVTVVGRGRNLADARTVAYRAAQQIAFTGCWYRGDIGEGATLPGAERGKA